MRTNRLRKPKEHHGFSSFPLYKRWTAIMSRVTDPDNACYRNYGGRGINICNDWKDYLNFMKWASRSGYRDDLVIDRIDVNGDYEPNNCRWVTKSDSSVNRRKKDDYCIQKMYRRYMVTVVRHRHHYYLGTFKTKDEAIKVRDMFLDHYENGTHESFPGLKSVRIYT
jgi:hypothetical protein